MHLELLHPLPASLLSRIFWLPPGSGAAVHHPPLLKDWALTRAISPLVQVRDRAALQPPARSPCGGSEAQEQEKAQAHR